MALQLDGPPDAPPAPRPALSPRPSLRDQLRQKQAPYRAPAAPVFPITTSTAGWTVIHHGPGPDPPVRAHRSPLALPISSAAPWKAPAAPKDPRPLPVPPPLDTVSVGSTTFTRRPVPPGPPLSAPAAASSSRSTSAVRTGRSPSATRTRRASVSVSIPVAAPDTPQPPSASRPLPPVPPPPSASTAASSSSGSSSRPSNKRARSRTNTNDGLPLRVVNPSTSSYSPPATYVSANGVSGVWALRPAAASHQSVPAGSSGAASSRPSLRSPSSERSERAAVERARKNSVERARKTSLVQHTLPRRMSSLPSPGGSASASGGSGAGLTQSASMGAIGSPPSSVSGLPMIVPSSVLFGYTPIPFPFPAYFRPPAPFSFLRCPFFVSSPLFSSHAPSPCNNPSPAPPLRRQPFAPFLHDTHARLRAHTRMHVPPTSLSSLRHQTKHACSLPPSGSGNDRPRACPRLKTGGSLLGLALPLLSSLPVLIPPSPLRFPFRLPPFASANTELHPAAPAPAPLVTVRTTHRRAASISTTPAVAIPTSTTPTTPPPLSTTPTPPARPSFIPPGPPPPLPHAQKANAQSPPLPYAQPPAKFAPSPTPPLRYTPTHSRAPSGSTLPPPPPPPQLSMAALRARGALPYSSPPASHPHAPSSSPYSSTDVVSRTSSTDLIPSSGASTPSSARSTPPGFGFGFGSASGHRTSGEGESPLTAATTPGSREVHGWSGYQTSPLSASIKYGQQQQLHRLQTTHDTPRSPEDKRERRRRALRPPVDAERAAQDLAALDMHGLERGHDPERLSTPVTPPIHSHPLEDETEDARYSRSFSHSHPHDSSYDDGYDEPGKHSALAALEGEVRCDEMDLVALSPPVFAADADGLGLDDDDDEFDDFDLDRDGDDTYDPGAGGEDEFYAGGRGSEFYAAGGSSMRAESGSFGAGRDEFYAAPRRGRSPSPIRYARRASVDADALLSSDSEDDGDASERDFDSPPPSLFTPSPSGFNPNAHPPPPSSSRAASMLNDARSTFSRAQSARSRRSRARSRRRTGVGAGRVVPLASAAGLHTRARSADSSILGFGDALAPSEMWRMEQAARAAGAAPEMRFVYAPAAPSAPAVRLTGSYASLGSSGHGQSSGHGHSSSYAASETSKSSLALPPPPVPPKKESGPMKLLRRDKNRDKEKQREVRKSSSVSLLRGGTGTANSSAEALMLRAHGQGAERTSSSSNGSDELVGRRKPALLSYLGR
ncbi:hypothetical protein B0H10DRAFT_2227005 [Mycena sp. CBHHK59/15]|nr:hypothetical protein B0H10DRAFT_2227005 [Mycena sp. CBHHK59/15]